MTTEEKAKRYDKLVKEVKDFFEGKQKMHSDITQTLEHLFPELKESEDERIRKAIISGMTAIKKQGKETFAAIHINDIIAWLEKQGEQKPQGKTALEAINEKKVDNQFCIKPVNKAEPKFHKGQWIVWQGKYFKVNYNGCGYELTDQNGKSTSLEYGTIDENAHLFNVEDAKDGDVLIDNNEKHPFIFKRLIPCDIKTNIINPLAVLGYCGIGGAGFTKGGGWGDTANCKYYPATKEVRDTLMRAMADAGYRWDKENLKLEKNKDETSIAVNNPDAYKIGFADGEAHAKEEQWKPSDEQIKHLTHVVYDAKHKNDISTHGYEPYFHLSNLLMQIKKLKG